MRLAGVTVRAERVEERKHNEAKNLNCSYIRGGAESQSNHLKMEGGVTSSPASPYSILPHCLHPPPHSLLPLFNNGTFLDCKTWVFVMLVCIFLPIIWCVCVCVCGLVVMLVCVLKFTNLLSWMKRGAKNKKEGRSKEEIKEHTLTANHSGRER